MKWITGHHPPETGILIQVQNSISTDWFSQLTSEVSSSGWIIRLVADTKGTVPGFADAAWVLTAAELDLAPTVIISSSSIANRSSKDERSTGKNKLEDISPITMRALRSCKPCCDATVRFNLTREFNLASWVGERERCKYICLLLFNIKEFLEHL